MKATEIDRALQYDASRGVRALDDLTAAIGGLREAVGQAKPYQVDPWRIQSAHNCVKNATAHVQATRA